MRTGAARVRTKRGTSKTVVLLAGAAWMALWAWLFAFAYSDSYFEYSLCTRLPVFAAAMFGALAVPAGAVLVWRRFPSIVGVVLGQAGVGLTSLIPLALTSFTLSRIPGPCHLSGDDAMGAGINFLLLAGAAAASVALMAAAGVARVAGTRRGARP